MISVTHFIMILAILMVSAFGGLWLGAYIHHRGVSIGSGNRESFTGRVPEGEVFRIPDADELPEMPPDEILTPRQMDRTAQFLAAIKGKDGV